MVEEWPVAAPTVADLNGMSAPTGGGRRLAAARTDFFLNPAGRLTEQERALMTAMLHRLVGRLADELRAGVPDDVAAASEIEAGALIAQLIRADLLTDERLVATLLRRAEGMRTIQPGQTEAIRRFLARLASDPEPTVARAAMMLALGRGRCRDGGRASIDLNDLEAELAGRLVAAVAATLARRSGAEDRVFADAASDLLARHDPGQGLESAEARLADALAVSGKLTDALLLTVAGSGDVALTAHALACLAGIAPDDARDMLVSAPEGQLALLLRLAGLSRTVAASLLASVGPNDPAAEIDRFDRLHEAEVEAARRWLTLPASYRQAAEALARHG